MAGTVMLRSRLPVSLARLISIVNIHAMLPIDPNLVRDRLISFQRDVRSTLDAARSKQAMHEVSHTTAADTIYAIDAEVDPMLEAFCEDWSKTTPLVLIAEGIEGDDGVEGVKVFPHGSRAEDALIQLIVDPIDGTRGIMYDKRPAWALAGVAPNKGDATRLSDVQVAVMTELPTSKMGYADVLSAIRGRGAQGFRVELSSGTEVPLPLGSSKAQTIAHGFASVSNFFPGTKVLASELMEHICRNLLGPADITKAMVFEDQYISTGGQLYEMMIGHDRFNCDLRPLFYQLLPQKAGLCVHPYDCASILVAEEAGVILTNGLDKPLDGPLDCTTSLSWAGFANRTMYEKVQPLIVEFFRNWGMAV